MSIIDELEVRGIINNITNKKKLIEAIQLKKRIYIGFDPSFESLHLGNYVMIALINRFKQHGIDAIALIGGATGMIGDPSGKKSERTLLDAKTVLHNAKQLSTQISKLTKATLFNNYEIYQNMTFFDFLRDVGKLVNVNYLLEKDIIKSRLETGISFTEFSYSIIQGFDFYWLYKNKDVAIQIGGSDQWGNITTGIEMIRKQIGEENFACGLTINLLTKQDGSKFGKSESGAIYLDSNISSPFEMYQFLINQNDDDLLKLFNFFSFKSSKEIETLLNEHNNDKSKRTAQKALAHEIITAVHGDQAYQQSLKIANALFYDKIAELSQAEFVMAIKQFNSYSAQNDILLSKFLIDNNILTSKRIFKELIEAKTLSINNEVIDEDIQINNKMVLFGQYTIIKKGKKNYFIIDWKKEAKHD